MASVIRLTNDARQTFRTSLGGVSARLTVWWQPSDAHWYLAVDGVTASARLVERGLPLLGRRHAYGGQLYVQGPGVPGRYAWEQTHVLVFLTDAELEGA